MTAPMDRFQTVVHNMEQLVYHHEDAICAALGWEEDVCCSLHVVHTRAGWCLRLGEHKHRLGGKVTQAARALEVLAATAPGA